MILMNRLFRVLYPIHVTWVLTLTMVCMAVASASDSETKKAALNEAQILCCKINKADQLLKHPESMGEWIAQLQQLPTEILQCCHRDVLNQSVELPIRTFWYLSLKLIDSPEALDLLKQESLTNEHAAKIMKTELVDLPYPIGLMMDPYCLSINWLDYYWGLYRASHDKAWFLPMIHLITFDPPSDIDAECSKKISMAKKHAIEMVNKKIMGSDDYRQDWDNLLLEIEPEIKSYLEEVLKSSS